MRVRSLAPAPRGLRAALIAAIALVATGAWPQVAGAAAPATSRPVKPRAVKGTVTGKRVTVRWTATDIDSVQIAVRRSVGRGKYRTRTRSVLGRYGVTSITLPNAVAVSKLRVRARRCRDRVARPSCSGWTRWRKPTRSKATGIPPVSTRDPVIVAPASGSPAPGAGVAPGTTTPITTAVGDGPTVGGCPQMPASWALNQRVDTLPVSANSGAYVDFLGTATKVHPDFGSADLGAGPDGFGIPFRVVPATEPLIPIDLGIYADESDPGPYPIPLDTPVEGGPASNGDRHVLVVRQGECKLYELGNAYPKTGRWEASVGAIFDLTTGAPRPTGWTSADAAGLPIQPLLARYDEVATGRIKHAIRMTAHGISGAYVPPASHFAQSSTSASAPPMGQRFRMKAGYDISGLTGQAKVIATAMKEYGLVLADTGSDWYVTGAPDRRWDEDDLGQLKGIPGSAFEAVDSAPVVRR